MTEYRDLPINYVRCDMSPVEAGYYTVYYSCMCMDMYMCYVLCT